ncbi:hypothetical protein N2152v2_009273 [Parachlorella kessleri]
MELALTQEVGCPAGLRVYALDAAMPFDFEHRMRARMQSQNTLKIGIVGFGTFGQFLARRMVKAGHQVIATSRSPYHKEAAEMGVGYFTDANDFCEEHPDVVILATSILSLEPVLAKLPVMRLKRSTLFVDVLSVKEFPKRLLLAKLPPEVDILCTHPMFGPDSGKGAWTGLNFMYEKVRVGEDEAKQQRVENFLQFFANEGCTMVEMACEEHDRHAASTQFITHTVGRMLGAMDLQPTVIDTKGFQSLLSLVDNTAHDSFELYYGLFMYNQNATVELERLEDALNQVKRQLLDQLHNKLRSQIFYSDSKGAVSASTSSSGSSSSSVERAVVQQPAAATAKAPTEVPKAPAASLEKTAGGRTDSGNSSNKSSANGAALAGTGPKNKSDRGT